MNLANQSKQNAPIGALPICCRLTLKAGLLAIALAIFSMSSIKAEPTTPSQSAPDTNSSSPVLTKAQNIIIPSIELQNATIVEAVALLRDRSKALDTDKTGINIVIKNSTDQDKRMVTLNLVNVSVAEVLQMIAKLGHYNPVYESQFVLLIPSVQATP